MSMSHFCSVPGKSPTLQYPLAFLVHLLCIFFGKSQALHSPYRIPSPLCYIISSSESPALESIAIRYSYQHIAPWSLQCTKFNACCTALKFAFFHCNAPQCTAMHCNELQCTAATIQCMFRCTLQQSSQVRYSNENVHCSSLQRIEL